VIYAILSQWKGYVHRRRLDDGISCDIRLYAFYWRSNAFTMRTGGMLDGREFGKRVRRLLDSNYSYRKILLIVLVFGGLLLYFGPSFAQWLFSTSREPIEGNLLSLKNLKCLFCHNSWRLPWISWIPKWIVKRKCAYQNWVEDFWEIFGNIYVNRFQFYYSFYIKYWANSWLIILNYFLF